MRMPEKRSKGRNLSVQAERDRIGSFNGFSDDGKHRVAIALGVFEALEHEHDRGIAGDASVLGEKRFDGALMNRFAREVSGAHYRRVELAVAEGADRKLERAHAGELLGCERKRRAANIELAVEPVGRNIRHRAEHALRTEERHDPFARSLHPGIVEPQRGGPLGEAPACSIARDLGIALCADQDARRLGRKAETFGGFPGGCEDHRLLTKRLLQVFGRKPQSCKFELHGLGGRALPSANQTATSQKRIGKVGSRTAITDPGAQGNDRDVRCGRRIRGLSFDALPLPLFDDEVGVVSPEAERTNHSLAGPFRVPGLGGLQDAKWRTGEDGVQLVDVRRRRANAMAHRSEHFHQTCDPGRRDQVAHVGLQRAYWDVGEAGVDFAHRANLGSVSDGRAGGVAFN
jgi:hypothetical protein